MNKTVVITSIVIAVFGLSLLTLNKFKSTTSSSIVISNSNDISTKITLAEIANHANSTSCWMAVDGKAYDITKYISQHPDGNSILKGCGLDATTMYQEVRKHNGQATQILPEYQIGVLSI